MTILQNLEEPNANLDLTMLISGLKHPKNIYNMSLFEKELKIQIKFEFKFNLEIKQKKKYKRKGKKNSGTAHLGWLRPNGPLLLSLAQAHRPTRLEANKRKKRNGPSPIGQAHGHFSLWPRRQVPLVLKL